jgi:hypothetical protein
MAMSVTGIMPLVTLVIAVTGTTLSSMTLLLMTLLLQTQVSHIEEKW